MPQLMVTKKLNRRSIIPAALPDDKSIVDTVPQGFIFAGSEVIPDNKIVFPAAPFDKWYKDSSGIFYWAGALLVIKESAPVTPQPSMPTAATVVSALQIKAATIAATTNAEKLLPYINDTLALYKINTPARILCFLSQTGHESGGLFFTEELASGKAYEGRADLGNTQPGDGVRFKGRGLIQITGRANYTLIHNDLGIDCVNNPALLGGKTANVCTPEQLRNAALTAGWFWNKRNLNALADKINIARPIEEDTNMDTYETITRRINGGTNGLADRVTRYKSGVAMFR